MGGQLIDSMCVAIPYQPIYSPQNLPLVSLNNNVDLGGIVIKINLPSLLCAGTNAANPCGNGYLHGPAVAPLEAASACPGVYGKGPYAGNLLVDPKTGACELSWPQR